MADKATFLSQIKEGALKSWEKYRVLPSLVAAQAILESEWGKSGLALQGNNLFGIKAHGWAGETIEMPTKEYRNGQLVPATAQWRKYNSWSDSVEDHGLFFVENKRYSTLLNEKDYKKAAILVKESGYATDPDYSSKLLQIIEGNKLYQWDEEAFNHEIKKATNQDTQLYRLVTGTFAGEESAKKAKENIEKTFGYIVHIKPE